MSDKKKSWLARLFAGLKRSATALSTGIARLFTTRTLDHEALEELEELLITSDMGVEAAGRITAALAQERFGKQVEPADIRASLADEIAAILGPVAVPLTVDRGHRPHVILMTGVNGAGKTTTIGKLARHLRNQRKSVLLAAADTFRAAAIEQLEAWGRRVGVPVVAGKQGGDPAAVAYQAVDQAVRDGIDIVLIDTAGRLQNKAELMEELAKVIRVTGKRLEGAPHDVILVLDGSTGQNVLTQIEVFQRAAGVTGLIMTKLDGSARGGILVAAAEKFGLPIHAIGVGEAIEDLQAFEARDFARALVGLEG